MDVKPTVKNLERNRVAMNFDVNEGSVSKIREINIVCNHVYSEKELLAAMQFGHTRLKLLLVQQE